MELPTTHNNNNNKTKYKQQKSSDVAFKYKFEKKIAVVNLLFEVIAAEMGYYEVIFYVS